MAQPTIYDVATAAGVGIATVSRVLAGGQRVAEATRLRVEAACRELGFRPNRAARRLASGGRNRPRVVALMPFFSASFYYAVARPLAQGLTDQDIDLVLCNVGTREDKQRILDRIVAERSAEGIVLGSMGIGEERRAQLAALGIPVVSIEYDLPDIPSVTVDNAAGGGLAARHLAACGSRHPALISGPPAAMPFRLREQGFQAAAGPQAPCARADAVTREAGAAAAARILDAHPAVDALACVNDLLAVGAVEELRRRGRDVPGQVQVIGFDDLPLMDALGISTIRQPMSTFGAWAARAIGTRIASPGAAVASAVLELDLVPRTTTRAATPSAPRRRHSRPARSA
jgi:DNA-binding LacI/PurR family transcriptional regulator